MEICFRVADIEEVSKVSARKREHRDAIHKRGDAHCVAPPCIGIAPIC